MSKSEYIVARGDELQKSRDRLAEGMEELLLL